MFLPAGFGHGFFVLSDEAEFLYKCDAFYDPHDERGVLWNDPRIGINWQIPDDMEVLLSEKDRNNPALANCRDEDLPRFTAS
jgi:dTDP-4-dehydrorhamnose 3,5-epimerase